MSSEFSARDDPRSSSVRSVEDGRLTDLLQQDIAPLQLLGREGSGGMAEIYLARDPRLRRTLAVKVLHSSLATDERPRARFLQEARVVATLNHPNIVSIHSVGELSDGTPYYMMDYVTGGSLEERTGPSGMESAAEAKRILGEVASALAAAHSAGVVHRDVKPANVLYDRDSGRSLLTDWGIATLRTTNSEGDEDSHTRPGQVLGSRGYMSPEQMVGDEVGPATDVFALGVLGFELLTGERPFAAPSPRAELAALFGKEPPPLHEVRDDVDPELSEIVSRCLAKDPLDRPTAQEVSARLGASKGAVEWPPPGLDAELGSGAPIVWKLGYWIGLSTVLLTLVVELSQASSGNLPVFMLACTATFLSVIMTIGAVLRAIPRFTATLAARRRGYDWATIADVLADTRGDTGMILTGSREYGGLSIRARRLFVGSRRTVLLLPMVAVLAATTLLLFLALQGPVLSSLALLGGGVSLALVLWALRRLEGLLLLRRRGRVAKRRRRSPELTDSWYRSLDRLSVPRLGNRGLSPLTPLPLAVLALALGVATTLVLPLLILGVTGVFADAMVAEALQETRIDVGRMRELDRWRSLMLPVEEEGDGGPELYSALSALGNSSPGWERPPRDLPAWSFPRDWPGLLGPLVTAIGGPGGSEPQASRDSSGQIAAGEPTTTSLSLLRHHLTLRDSLLVLANHGLAPELVRWIETITAHPSVAALERAARRSRVDLLGAVWDSTSLAAAPLEEVQRDPAGNFHLLADAKYLEAALHLNGGRWREAETSLREPLTVAYRLLDTDYIGGHRRIEEIVTSLERIARLHQLRHRSRETAAAIRSTLTGLGQGNSSVDPRPSSWVDASSLATELLASPSLAPSHTLSAARAAALSSRCGSFLEVAAGPREPTRSALTLAHASMNASPQLRAYWRRFVDGQPGPEQLKDALRSRGLPVPLPVRIIPEWVAKAAEVVGNPRILRCRWYPALAELYAFG